MPLTESGRAFWSLDETEALLAAAPRWGFSAAKLRENVAQLAHFSTKQVSSKLADLQIQNRDGVRATATKKKNASQALVGEGGTKSERLSGHREAHVNTLLLNSGGVEGVNEGGSDASTRDYSQPGSPIESTSSTASANPKKRERAFSTEQSSPDAKRALLLDLRLQNRLPYGFASAGGLAPMATLPGLIGAGPAAAAHFPTAVSAHPAPFPFSPASLMLPPFLGLTSPSHLFPSSDKLATSLETGTAKRALMLKEGFPAPPGTKPSLTEVPHPAIRCYSSPDIFKIVINPVLFGTTVDLLVPQESSGHSRALLKIDWKLAATPFDADFDFRRHPSLTELFLCPLPSNVNPSFNYSLHHTPDAMCLIFPLNRPAFSNFNTAIAALSSLAAASADESTPSGAAPASSSSATPLPSSALPLPPTASTAPSSTPSSSTPVAPPPSVLSSTPNTATTASDSVPANT